MSTNLFSPNKEFSANADINSIDQYKDLYKKSIELIEFNSNHLDKIEEAISNSDVVINLIGILYENRKQ